MNIRSTCSILAVCLSIITLAYSERLSAASTNVVLNLTGSKSCNALVESAYELPVRNSYSIGPQSITQELSADRRSLLSFTAVLPVSVVLLDLNRGGTRAYYYPTPGALADSDLIGGGAIRKVRYCYGNTTAPAVRESLKSCSQFGISCAPGANNVLVTLDPDLPNWGARMCACGSAAFAECNPTLPVGVEGGCATGQPLPEAPVQMDMIRDGTYLCITLGGFRKCYRR